MIGLKILHYQILEKLGEGRTVAIYMWDYTGKMGFLQKFWEAAIELRNEEDDTDALRSYDDRIIRASNL